jgi:trimeric autotransporter adhesin
MARLGTKWALLWIGCSAANLVYAQLSGSNIISTFAGTAWKFQGEDGPAVDATLSSFNQLSTDPQGNVIFADYGNHLVSRLNADGTITVLAGNGIGGFSGDHGPALSASLNRPSSAVMDAAGNLYIYDSTFARIRRVTPDGIIATYAGTGFYGYSGDHGPATKAAINNGGKLAVDYSGNLYLTDPFANVVRVITSDGIISTYAGNGKGVHAGDNIPATQAALALGTGQIVCDAAGNLYLAEDGASLIRKISPAGIITTVAGTGRAGYKDGPVLSAQFDLPVGLALDGAGNIYVGDKNNHVVRQISPGGTVSTIAGVSGSFGFSGDGGPPLKAVFRYPTGIAIDAAGNININDSGNLRIRAFSTGTNVINTVAGNGLWRTTPDGAPATQAYFFAPQQISFDSKGNLLIADSQTYRVRRVNADGTFQTLAGNGATGIGGVGGPATKALLSNPIMAVADSAGSIYIADAGASVIYRVGPAGNMSVFAGQEGNFGYGGDNGPAAKAVLNGPVALAFDAAGSLYIAERFGNCIRKVAADSANTITTYAGTCGKFGFSGQNVPAKQALLSGPQAIAFDSQGNLIVADTDNNRIRKITPAGVISTIAGTGENISNGNNGPATAASVLFPDALAVDPQGTIYFAEGIGTHVRLITPAGRMSAFAGTGYRALAGDGGAATSGAFGGQGLALDAAGNLYISDFFNDRIRIVLASPPVLSAAVMSLSFTAASGGGPTAPQAVALSSTLTGQLLTAKSDSPWLMVPLGIESAPQNLQVYVNPAGLAPGKYQGNVTLQTPGVSGALITIPVTVTVSAAVAPRLRLDAPALDFSFLHSAAPQTQSFSVQNSGGGTLTFQATVSGAASGGVTLSSQSGSALPSAPVTIVVTVDPTQLPDGASSGEITIKGSTGQTINLPITITIVPSQPRMTLPQRGFLFTAVQGGGVTPPQSLAVLNSGNAAFSYTASAIPMSGSGWLRAAASSGTSSPSAYDSVTISVNPAGLGAGVYYGLVRVASPGTVNSPQEVEVVLNLLKPQFDPGAVVGPTGLVFAATAGNSNPGSQKFQITNLSASATQFALRPVPLGGAWLTASPDSGTLAAGASRTITVQASVDDLAPGVYHGSIAMQIGAVPRAAEVLFVVAPGTQAVSTQILSIKDHDADAACSPTTLYPVFTSFVQDFQIPANWPNPIEVNVVDDCGSPMTAGRVVTSFSNGDPPLALSPLNDGRWQGTWFGRVVRSNQIVISASAIMDSPQLKGTFAYTGTLQTNAGVPSVNAGGVTVSAVAATQAQLSPGSVISISGVNLALSKNVASQLPLATALSGTQVLLGGELLPLLYTSGGLINAIVPYDLGVNADYQVFVSSGAAISGPQTVTLATAHPSIFKIDNTGAAQVARDVWNRITNGTPPTPATAAPSSAIGAGDSLVIYCTGLGGVNQTIDPTAAAPGTVATTNAVSVSVGGQSATPTFAGLVPGYTGLYQVNVTVPSGVAAGSSVPVMVTVAGQNSAAINVSVH